NLEGEIPEEMFDARADEMVQDFEYRLSSQGMNLDTYMQYTGSTRDSLRASFKEQATRQVKVALALEKIVAAEGLTASDEEVEEEVNKLAEQYKAQNITADQIKAAMGEQLKNDIAQKKAVELIKSTAVAE
ncbi:MAG: trigger factor, partial [Oscillospiraceae bacterium]|nr:trigger factor [Oscillospiraceae bacterium]